MIIDDIMTEKITLHGLGFVQVQLPGNQRIHVWHPELPRRECFLHSSVHNHRFSFQSQVLVGEQINMPITVKRHDLGTHVLYVHEGKRTANGGRPWVADGHAMLTAHDPVSILPGQCYRMQAYDFHRTESGGDGRVATLLTKLDEGTAGAHSSCLYGISPDADFDRFQWKPSKLWEIVSDVLTGAAS